MKIGIMGLKRAAVENYLRKLAVKMNLSQWEIAFDPDASPDNGAHADIEASEGQHALVTINEKVFRNATPGEQREMLVHELCHLYTDRIRNMGDHMKDSLVSVMKKIGRNEMDRFVLAAAITFAGEEFYDAEEYAVQGFARIIAPHMPMPPKF